ncbi:MAG: hypothetical protein AB7U82_27610 [Blastocatellales bacterium]
MSKDELQRRARLRAVDPAIFDEYEPIFFPVEASNNSLDAYYTKQALSSLRNYAQSAEAGVSFQESHKTHVLGLGASLSGRLIEEPGKDLVRVTADIFTLPGLDETRSFIFKLRSGIARDVSIGFYDADFICGLCGLDLWDWDCPHIPGVSYQVERRDGKGNVISTDEELAYAWVENARLAEISIVYEGATPGCGVLKAGQEAEGGRVTPQIAERFAVAYRGLTIPGYQRSWPGHAEKEEKPMSANKDQRSAPPVIAPALAPEASTPSERRDNAPLTTPAAQAGGVTDTTVERSIVETAIHDAGITSSDIRAGLTRLGQLAADGRRYRADLIESALAEGVRVFGNDFAKETYRAMFERSELDEIKRVLDGWKGQSASLLPAGRQTSDTADKPEEGNEPTQVRAADDDPRFKLLPPNAFGG